MSLDETLRERFVCQKCHQTQAEVKRIATSGTGLSRMFDIEHNVFVAVSCTFCGFTEFYNPHILEGRDDLGTVLDILFGG
jgi:uncharacterized protein